MKLTAPIVNAWAGSCQDRFRLPCPFAFHIGTARRHRMDIKAPAKSSGRYVCAVYRTRSHSRCLHQRVHVHGCWPNSRPNNGQWQAAPCSSCRVLHPLGKRPAAATSLRTRSAGIGARHVHSIEDETWDRVARRCCPKWARGAINEGGSHPSHTFLRRHVSVRSTSGRESRQRGLATPAGRTQGAGSTRGGTAAAAARASPGGGGARRKRSRARRGSTWVPSRRGLTLVPNL